MNKGVGRRKLAVLSQELEVHNTAAAMLGNQGWRVARSIDIF